jgi:hypothetical protein
MPDYYHLNSCPKNVPVRLLHNLLRIHHTGCDETVSRKVQIMGKLSLSL